MRERLRGDGGGVHNGESAPHPSTVRSSERRGDGLGRCAAVSRGLRGPSLCALRLRPAPSSHTRGLFLSLGCDKVFVVGFLLCFLFLNLVAGEGTKINFQPSCTFDPASAGHRQL